MLPNYRQRRLRALCFILALSNFFIRSATAQESLSAAELKKLSVEELMNLRVTLVSRTPQHLNEVASAIQVLSGDDIRRSGATNLPDALRLIPNIQVAQLNSNAWIVGVRGFNTLFANKLLVMIDGRTIYTPLFGGVIWDLQHVLLEDIDRIEVISGPGGTLWGANAVNGVINIVTKRSNNTQGTYVSGLAGNFLADQFEVRHGGKLGKNSFFRVYGMHMDRKPTFMRDETKNTDAWGVTQAGFRIDLDPNDRDAFTIQGDIYRGNRKTTPEHSSLNGQNLSGTWTRKFNTASDIVLKVYFDRYFREDIPGNASDELMTADVDFQHRLPLGRRHEILWGIGYRYVRDDFKTFTQNVAILPPKKNLDLINGFIQEQFSVSEKFKITAGTKILHNVYTGVEWQPSIRAAFQPNHRNTFWSAVSRAVRTPSRFDRDYFIPGYRVPPSVPSVSGGPDFQSENLTAYELGYRVQPTPVSTFSASAFYNVYTDVYSIEQVPGTATYQIMNNTDGEAWGFELTGAYQLIPQWRLRAGYTYIDKDLRVPEGNAFTPDYLGNDAKHRFLVHSMVDLPANFQWDLVARYTDQLDSTIATTIDVPSYFTFDTRLAWQYRKMELSVTGQNLAQKRHMEFGQLRIPRSIYVKIAARF
jgi:iron complex outermembrane receptor protein